MTITKNEVCRLNAVRRWNDPDKKEKWLSSTVSTEANKKRSLTLKGKKKSLQHCENIRKANMGKRLSEETKKKISLTSKGRVAWNKGVKGIYKLGERSPEVKLKIGLANKGKVCSEEARLKMSKTKKQLFKDGILVSWMKGKTHTEESKQKNREATINRLISGKYPQTNTKIEKRMKKALEEMKLEYIHSYNFNNKFECDFALPKHKIIIECDGDYWHRRADAKKRDAPKNSYIPKCGWKLLRFWETDINNNIDYCKNIINKTIGE